MRNLLIFSFLTLFGLIEIQAQDTLVVNGFISTTASANLNGAEIIINYYDTGTTVLATDTVLTNGAGFYTDQLVNSNVRRVDISMETCNGTGIYYTKSLNVGPYSGTRVVGLNFSNFCFSADFTYSINNLNVSFSEAVTGGVGSSTNKSYSWDYGDGNNGTGRFPNHQYASSGIYTVTLLCRDSMGDSTEVQKTINLLNCSAKFSYSLLPNNTVQFSDSSNPWQSGTRLWDFGDGNTSTAFNPRHTYNTSGYFQVCLQVNDSNTYCQASVCDSVYINPPSCNASFDTVHITNTIIRFVNNSSHSGSNVNYLWDFGDGATSTDSNPTHMFKDSGFYNVSLNINVDSGNCLDSETKALFLQRNINARIISGQANIDLSEEEVEVNLISFNGSYFEITQSMMTSGGYYSFEVNSGVYYLKAGLPNAHPNHSLQLPEYYDQQYTWENATSMVVSSADARNNDFNLRSLANNTFGNSLINGTVTKDNLPESDANIYLFQSGKFIKRTYTKGDGTYALLNLDAGNYQVILDVIGYSSQRQDVTISFDGQAVTDVDFGFTNMAFSTPELNEQSFIVYPNPVQDILYVKSSEQILTLDVIEATGRSVKSVNNPSQSDLISIDLNDLKSGYYVIRIVNRSTTESIPIYKMN